MSDALDVSFLSDDVRTSNADKNAVVVVVEGSRSICLAVVPNLVSSCSVHIVASCRNVNDVGAISALWNVMSDRFSLRAMDICFEKSVRLFILCITY